MHTFIELVQYFPTSFLSIIPYVERWSSCLSLWTSSVTCCGCPLLVVSYCVWLYWRVTITAGKDSPHMYSHINVCRGRARSSWMMLLGQQVCWDLPHRFGSAPLSSLSSLNKDRHNLLLCFSLSTFTSPISLLHHLSPMSFFIFLSTWIYFYFCSFPLSCQHVFPPSLDWLFLWRLLLGDTACRTWFCGSGLLTATGSRRQVWQGWGSQSKAVGSKASSSGHPFSRVAWFLFCHPWRSTSHRLMCPCHILGGLLLLS